MLNIEGRCPRDLTFKPAMKAVLKNDGLDASPCANGLGRVTLLILVCDLLLEPCYKCLLFVQEYVDSRNDEKHIQR